MQDKEAMEAAVRAFEDWEFRVLEKESGIDDEEESFTEDKDHGSDVEIQKEIICQQLLVNASQVNNIPHICFIYVLLQRLWMFMESVGII